MLVKQGVRAEIPKEVTKLATTAHIAAVSGDANLTQAGILPMR